MTPRGRDAARVLAGALALQLPFGIAFAWGAAVPFARAHDHWPALLLGAVFSATPAGYGAGTVIGGRLGDRLPPRRLCWASLGLLAAGFAVAFGAPGGLTFVAGYALFALGAGGGLALTGAVAAVTQVLPRRAGAAGGLVSAAYASSAVFQAPLVSFLAPRLGWLGALEAVGLAMAAVAAAGLLLVPALPARPRAAAPGLLLTRPVLRGALLAMCGSMFGACAAVNLPGEAAALAGATAALLALGNAGGRLLGGLLADRVGAARVVAAVLALDVLAGLLLLARPGPGPALVAAPGAGLALGGGAGSLARVGRDATPERPHAGFGLVFAGFTTGAFAGPLLGALVGVPLAWAVTAAPAAIGLALSAGRAAGAVGVRRSGCARPR